MKQLNEIARMQQLAGINEIKLIIQLFQNLKLRI